MTERSPLTADALRLSRLHEAARLEAQRLRRCAIRQALDPLWSALQRGFRGQTAQQGGLRGTGRALPAPSGSARTPPQTSPCAG